MLSVPFQFVLESYGWHLTLWTAVTIKYVSFFSFDLYETNHFEGFDYFDIGDSDRAAGIFLKR